MGNIIHVGNLCTIFTCSCLICLRPCRKLSCKKEAETLEGVVKVKLGTLYCRHVHLKFPFFGTDFTGYTCPQCNRKFSRVWEVRFVVYILAVSDADRFQVCN